MRAHSVTVLLFAAFLFSSCTTPTAPSAAILTVSFTPTPLVRPEPGQRLSWDITWSERAGTGLYIDHEQVDIVDPDGKSAGQLRGGGWPVNKMRVEGGRSTTVRGLSMSFLGNKCPCTFHYTVTYVDDLGNALSTSVDVPVI